jgi:hypothetical protein
MGSRGSRGSSEYRARQRERERRRRQQPERAAVKDDRPAPESPAKPEPDRGARRAAGTTCGWCGSPITLRSRGPIPKWCSATCRHRAWEQARAAASGRSAVQVVERLVAVPAKPPAATRPRQSEWVHLLRELTAQLEQGAIYERHVIAIAQGLDEVGRAVRRRSRAAAPRRLPGPGGDAGVTAPGALRTPRRSDVTPPGCQQSADFGAFRR